MNPESVKIQFHFPKPDPSLSTKESFVAQILKEMRADSSIKYTGYNDHKEFEESLKRTLGNENISSYAGITDKGISSINRITFETIEKCHAALPHPDLPIFVFIYPWFPNSKDKKDFGGSTAFVAYYTMHVFVDITAYSKASLEQTIAHEWNHLVYYRYHDYPYTLRSHIVMEGLAEVFREEVVSGEVAPWSTALNENEIRKQIDLLSEKMQMTDMQTYRDVFFGNAEYKRWTGYSIGYFIAKKFRTDHPDASWTDILKLGSEELLNPGSGLKK